MMNTRSLTILGSLAVLVIVVAWLMSSSKETAPSQAGQPVFPGLMDQINEVTALVIRTQSETLNIVQQGDSWIVKEKHGYPANMGKIREAVIGLGELTIIEAKTKKPELYEKLGLEDVDADGSGSTEVILKDEDGNSLAEAIVGKERPAKGNPEKEEVYIRKPGDPQTWLAMGKFSVEKIPGEWLEKDFLEIEPKRVRRVVITHPDKTQLVLVKEKPGELDFKVANLPEGEEVQSQFAVNNVVSTVTELGLEDVKPSSEIAFEEHAVVTADFETFDGIEGTVKLLQQDEKNYVKVSATFNGDLIWQRQPEKEPEPKKQPEGKGAADKDKEDKGKEEVAKPQPPKIKPESEVKAEIEDLNKRVTDWVYIIPKFRADTILKKPEDLIKKS